jgi:hypothetical protein
MIFINYNNTYNRRDNLGTYISLFGDTIFNLHKEQDIEERVNGYSRKQYEALVYRMVYDYCINLRFVVLETISNETIEESEARQKELYRFNEIQTNMAHRGIDIDALYNSIIIPYEDE